MLLLALLGAGSVGAQGGGNQAGLVVQYGDGSVETACVRFSEPEISGIELIERSGLPVIAAADGGGVGGAVCKIGPDGCDYPAEGCFCRRDGARAIYWAFYTLDGDAWAYATLGAGTVRVFDGDVHGWAWGLGESGTGAEPPVQDLEAICGPAAAPAPSATALVPSAVTTAPASSATALASSAVTAATTTMASAPAPTATLAPAAQAGGPWGYLGFGALVLILGAGAAIMARRGAR